MSGTGIIRKIVAAIDRRFLANIKATSVPGSNHHLILICFHPYNGKKPVRIPPQVIIHPGDPICEIHLSNQQVIQMATEANERSMEWRIFEILKEEFGLLAKTCLDGRYPQKFMAVYGVNTMGSSVKRFGFTLIPLPKGWNKLWLGFWESLLRKIFYSYKTSKKATFKRMMDPHEIWISKEELIRKYLKKYSR
jgi:hypothetical protein